MTLAPRKIAAAKLDRNGLHARDCECYACSIGHGPTEQERWRADVEWERKQEEAKQKAADTRAGKRREQREAQRAAERAQRRRDEEERRRFCPPSPMQMNELKAQYPWARRSPR